jgi:hypothetical protein
MTIKNCFKNHVRGSIKQSIVDKTNVMCPFCVRHHVNIHSDVLVASIMIDARKKLIYTLVAFVMYGNQKWIQSL